MRRLRYSQVFSGDKARTRKRPTFPEQTLQTGMFNQLNPLSLTHGHKNFYAFHVPLGGYRRSAEAIAMRAAGTKAGISDVILLFPPAPGESYGRAVFVEVKVWKSKDDPTPEQLLDLLRDKKKDNQLKFRDIAIGLGFDHYVLAARDVRDAVDQTLGILGKYVNLKTWQPVRNDSR